MNGVTTHVDTLSRQAYATCPACSESNAVEATFCKSCAHELGAVAPDAMSREQRIKNFSAWQQAVVAAKAPATRSQPRRAGWSYWIAGTGIAVVCFAVLAYLLSRLPAL